jgi:hypothetical protein
LEDESGLVFSSFTVMAQSVLRPPSVKHKLAPGGSVLMGNSSERGYARSVSRSALKMLRLVSDTAALRANQDTAQPVAGLPNVPEPAIISAHET